MPRPFHPAFAVVVLLALAGCANPRLDQAVYARTALVGMPEETLLSCAGVPDRSRTVSGREYLTYESQTLDGYGGSGASVGAFGGSFGSSSGLGVGIGLGLPLGSRVSSDYCEATFTMVDGEVAELAYNTPTGGRSRGISQCYDIVRSCLTLVPPMPAE